MQSRMMKYSIWINNQCFLNLQKGIETIKYWSYRLDEHSIQLANRLFECIYPPLFSTRFLIWDFFSRVIIQIEIRHKLWLQRVPSIESVFSLNISQDLTTLRDMIDYFSNFVIVKVHKLPQLVFSTRTRTKVIVYVNNKIFNIYRSLAPFPAHKCAKWQGQPKSKHFFRSPCSFCIFWRRLWICIIRRIRYIIIPAQWNASLTSLHTSNICYAVEHLASQARCHNQSWIFINMSY